MRFCPFPISHVSIVKLVMSYVADGALNSLSELRFLISFNKRRLILAEGVNYELIFVIDEV